MHSSTSTQPSQGLECLQEPILPLVRLLHLLFLTGPFETIAEILPELPEEIEQGPLVYRNPKKILSPYLDILEDLRASKKNELLPYSIVNENGEQIDGMESIEAWVSQRVIARELEKINSLLCHPCGCALCCIGPTKEMAQEYFEIPLASEETNLFQLKQIDTSASRSATAETAPTLTQGDQPFYRGSPNLIHWSNGWSLILPRNSHCPQLAPETNSCLIYPKRPDVCRRPQIFPYLLEPYTNIEEQEHQQHYPMYTLRNMLLAIWDCPYVRQYKDQIATYAELCQLEPIFKANKS